MPPRRMMAAASAMTAGSMSAGSTFLTRIDLNIALAAGNAEKRSGAQVTRIVVTGSECTGKTTLARDLAAAYGVECVPEFVRAFVDTIGGRPQFSDHGPIARGQKALEDEYRARAESMLFHDTDLLSTVAYCRAYFGRCPEWIEAAAIDRQAALYFLCDIDVPWQPDGLRDRGERRPEMHALFESVLKEARANYVVVRGSREARLAAARGAINALSS
jgi:NadR type nicotinamide-nucleotide adenylyltransferase